MAQTAANHPPRRAARVVETLAFLTLSGILGLIWLPVMVSYGQTPTDFPRILFRDLVWLVATGLLFGIFVRWLALFGSSSPPVWHALWFPLVACTTRSIFVEVLGPQFDGDPPSGAMWLLSVFFCYTCGAFIVMPVAAIQFLALRWMHGLLHQWGAQAGRRAIRHMAYGLAAAALLGGAEIARNRHLVFPNPIESLSRLVGVSLPADAVIVGATEDMDTYLRRWWVRGHFENWPPVPHAMAVTSPESVTKINDRARRFAGTKIWEGSSVYHAKWYTPSGDLVIGILIRSRHGDYCEFSMGAY